MIMAVTLSAGVLIVYRVGIIENPSPLQRNSKERLHQEIVNSASEEENGGSSHYESEKIE